MIYNVRGVLEDRFHVDTEIHVPCSERGRRRPGPATYFRVKSTPSRTDIPVGNSRESGCGHVCGRTVIGLDLNSSPAGGVLVAKTKQCLFLVT